MSTQELVGLLKFWRSHCHSCLLSIPGPRSLQLHISIHHGDEFPTNTKWHTNLILSSISHVIWSTKANTYHFRLVHKKNRFALLLKAVPKSSLAGCFVAVAPGGVLEVGAIPSGQSLQRRTRIRVVTFDSVISCVAVLLGI